MGRGALEAQGEETQCYSVKTLCHSVVKKLKLRTYTESHREGTEGHRVKNDRLRKVILLKNKWIRT